MKDPFFISMFCDLFCLFILALCISFDRAPAERSLDIPMILPELEIQMKDNWQRRAHSTQRVKTVSSEREKVTPEVAKTSMQKALRTRGTRFIRLRCFGFSRGVTTSSLSFLCISSSDYIYIYIYIYTHIHIQYIYIYIYICIYIYIFVYFRQAEFLGVWGVVHDFV